MKLGYLIIYVDDVREIMRFYENAFGLEKRFMHESGDYGEMATGETVIAFAAHSVGELNLPAGYRRTNRDEIPFGFELALVTEALDSAFSKAVAAGATALSPPSQKPWGQSVAYVRSLEGTIIELCTPIATND